MAAVPELTYGVVSGLAFNPVASAAGVAVAGLAAGAREDGRGRLAVAFLLLAGAWALGDGLAAVDAAAQVPVSWGWAYPLVWAVVALLAGYALPFAAGRFVGVRVTHGTGRLSAVSVGLTVSFVLGYLGASQVWSRLLS
ncbi:MAG: hypothetical protein Kow0056_09270 [Coriobacteriia bacterium]